MLAKRQAVHIAEKLSSLGKCLLDDLNGSPSKIGTYGLIVRLLQLDLMAVGDMGDCVVTGFQEMEVIIIMRMNDLPCKSYPLVKMLERMTVILESSMILGDFTIGVGKEWSKDRGSQSMSPVKMI